VLADAICDNSPYYDLEHAAQKLADLSAHHNKTEQGFVYRQRKEDIFRILNKGGSIVMLRGGETTPLSVQSDIQGAFMLHNGDIADALAIKTARFLSDAPHLGCGTNIVRTDRLDGQCGLSGRPSAVVMDNARAIRAQIDIHARDILGTVDVINFPILDAMFGIGALAISLQQDKLGKNELVLEIMRQRPRLQDSGAEEMNVWREMERVGDLLRRGYVGDDYRGRGRIVFRKLASRYRPGLKL